MFSRSKMGSCTAEVTSELGNEYVQKVQDRVILGSKFVHYVKNGFIYPRSNWGSEYV